MLLHNQTNRPLRWEANGIGYEWEPYGSCEVPDIWLPHIRSQGVRVDVSAVAPQKKAEIAAQVEREAQASSELVHAQQRLAEAEGRAAQAAKAAEISSTRETKALELLENAEAKIRTQHKQIEALKADAAEYEKLLTEANARIESLERKHAPAKPADKKHHPTG
jgi:chromosome segregation ATPase